MDAAGVYQQNISGPDGVELAVNQVFAAAANQKKNFAEFVVMELRGDALRGNQVKQAKVLQKEALLLIIGHGKTSKRVDLIGLHRMTG